MSFSAAQPAGTAVKFQVAASNASYGPFNYVGPDGTAATFFTTSGASLSQFDGFRYLRYKAFLSTTDPTVTPSLSSVVVCFQDAAGLAPTALAVAPATGTFGGVDDALGDAHGRWERRGRSERHVHPQRDERRRRAPRTRAVWRRSPSASLAGIGAGSYPTGVGASFAGDATHAASTGSSSLTVGKAGQAISVTTHAPASAAFASIFMVAATGGGSGNAVTFSSAGACSNVGATFTMTASAPAP